MLFVFQEVTTMEDYTLLHNIQGSFHQGNIKAFGDTAGRLCTCIPFFVIAYARFRTLFWLIKISCIKV